MANTKTAAQRKGKPPNTVATLRFYDDRYEADIRNAGTLKTRHLDQGLKHLREELHRARRAARTDALAKGATVRMSEARAKELSARISGRLEQREEVEEKKDVS